MITILYFARLRESLGKSTEQVELPPGVRDVGGLQRWLAARGGAWAEELAAGRNVRAAVNQAMARPSDPLKADDEVAFFPPVTGG